VIFTARQHTACYAERRTWSIPSVWPSVKRWYCVITIQTRIMWSSLKDIAMTIVSLWLTSARTFKGNIGSGVSGHAEWERGR